MGFNFAPNQVKVDFGSYRHYWRGVKKIGKTTMFADVIKEHYGDYSAGLIISFGNETGYKALDGVFAEEVPNWKKFEELVDELVNNKSNNSFKTLAFDTVDELVAIATEEALAEHKRASGKVAKSLNEIMGGFGAGHDYVKKIINKMISRLEGAGYGIVFISHTKIKTIKDKTAEEDYDVLTGNLEARFDGIFADKADIIAVFYNERTTDDDTGLLDKTQRFIYFRDDGFVDCGTRFKNMPSRVSMSAKEYLKAFEAGVKGSMIKVMNESEMEAKKIKEIQEREESAKNYKDSESTEDGASLKEKIVALATKKIKANRSATKAILKKYVDDGDPRKIDENDESEEYVEKMNNLLLELNEVK